MTPEQVAEFRAVYCDKLELMIALDALEAAERELNAARTVVKAARYMTCQDHLTQPKNDCCYCSVDKALAAYDRSNVGNNE